MRWLTVAAFFDPNNRASSSGSFTPVWLIPRERTELMRFALSTLEPWAHGTLEEVPDPVPMQPPIALRPGGFVARVITATAQASSSTAMRPGLRAEMTAFQGNPQVTSADFDGQGLVSPLRYWGNKQQIFPTLARLARCVLPIAATSIESEQMFSASGTMSSGQRASVGKDLLEHLMFLYGNMTRRDVEMVGKREVQAVRQELRQRTQVRAMEALIARRVQEEVKRQMELAARRASQPVSSRASTGMPVEISPVVERQSGLQDVQIQPTDTDIVFERMEEEEFAELDIELEIPPTDIYAELDVQCVDDVLAAAPEVEAVEEYLCDVSIRSTSIDY